MSTQRNHKPWEAKAAQKLGMETVPVHVAMDLSPDQIKAYRIADNKTAELAEWNYDLLPIELGELQASGFDLSLLGFDGDELLKLLSTEVEEGLTDPDDVPAPPDEAVTQPGDLWILGNHRLLCGDSSKPEDLDRLLGGKTIQLVNTDPPYNVKVEPRSNNAIAAGLSRASRRYWNVPERLRSRWPNAWGTWDNTIEAHRRLVDQYIDNLMPSRVTYAQERGIVIAGGGHHTNTGLVGTREVPGSPIRAILRTHSLHRCRCVSHRGDTRSV
ncbi:MAG: hypothetical protein NTV29_19340 [Planctomycetota bacterium]|nr:hypothetical protein [Planctomycetota bacterium]